MAVPASLAAGANGALRRLPLGLVYALGVLPAIWLFWLGLTGGLGPDPVKTLERRYGEIALQLMVAVLAVSPLRRFTGLSLIRFRRALGLLAFAYVSLHLLVWAVLNVQLDWAGIVTDVLERPYITIGMAGFLMLVPLAATSNDAAIRRLGATAWRRLHLLTYPAALAGALHHLLLTKTWELEPALYAGAILFLLLLRAPRLRAGRSRRAS